MMKLVNNHPGPAGIHPVEFTPVSHWYPCLQLQLVGPVGGRVAYPMIFILQFTQLP